MKHFSFAGLTRLVISPSAQYGAAILEKPVSDRGTTEDLSQSAESRTLTSQRLDFVFLRFGRELRQLRPVPLRVLRVTENSGDSRLVRVERWAARQQLTHEYFQQTLSGLIADPPMAKAH